MGKTRTRMTTVHVPSRTCRQGEHCTMSHYVQVPVITLRGEWNFQDSAHIVGRN